MHKCDERHHKMKEELLRKLRESIYYLIILTILLVLADCTRNQSNEEFGGVVSAATPEAATAGVKILEAGGNAVDAAVAVAFALAVTEPAMSGLGGQTQMLIHMPDQKPFVINGTSRSPAATPENIPPDSISGHRATTIPSTVRTLAYAWKHYGSGNISWARLLKPAIGYAKEGFPVGHFRWLVWKRHAKNLQSHPSTRLLFLTAEGQVPEEGKLWKQPVLAQTLQRLAEYGPQDFYRGQIAKQIVRDMQAHGGWISFDDLKNFREPEVIPALQGSYRGWQIYTLPPPGGGWIVLQILNMLENLDARELEINHPARILHIARALKIGYLSRKKHPVKNLSNYESEIFQKIDKRTAKILWQLEETAQVGETTHFSVVDAQGMAVAVTASINSYFGAKVANPELGFLYNNYMKEFVIGEPDHPFALKPNAMPYSSMSPTIVAREGRPYLVLGSPGSSRIISAVAQVIQLWVDAKLNIQQAVAFPRIHVVPENKLYIEAMDSLEIPEKIYRELKEWGFVLKNPRTDLATGRFNPYFGGVHALAFENDHWQGAADPRRDGAVKYARVKVP